MKNDKGKAKGQEPGNHFVCQPLVRRMIPVARFDTEGKFNISNIIFFNNPPLRREGVWRKEDGMMARRERKD